MNIKSSLVHFLMLGGNLEEDPHLDAACDVAETRSHSEFSGKSLVRFVEESGAFPDVQVVGAFCLTVHTGMKQHKCSV